MVRRKRGSKRNVKTGFEHFLKMDMQEDTSAKDDLEWERKLAKKLKVKDGKLQGMDDGIRSLFEEIPSVIDSLEEEVPDAQEFSKRSSGKKRKKLRLVAETSSEDVLLEQVSIKMCSTKKHEELLEQGVEGEMAHKVAIRVEHPVKTFGSEVVMEKKAPALEDNIKYKAPCVTCCEGNELEEYHQIRRQIRGLLNRLSESNVESITKEIVTIFHSVDRSISSQIISKEVLASCSGGHRGNEQHLVMEEKILVLKGNWQVPEDGCPHLRKHAAVFAAFVAGMAYLVGKDFSAELVACLAKSFEDEYLRKGEPSLRNLTLLLSYLYICNVFTSDLIYDLLMILSERLLEIDVSTILTILQCSGTKLRHDDPVAMKNFILSVQSRMNALKATSEDGKSNINTKRMEFMLETICNLRNNKKSSKEDIEHYPQMNKWLQKLRVGNIVIRGLKWSRLLDPDKSGQWWLSSNIAFLADNAEEVAAIIDREVSLVQKMLQLAATLGMNTEVRKAIFCVVMTAVDVVDAFQKLLRLNLPGKQDRDIMRVILRCCLQEEAFNKYYTTLASHLCKHDKNHKYTLQYCLWDQFKMLESMDLRTSSHLARFVAEMLASFTLSPAVLKTVELSDCKQLTSTRIMHFFIMFEAIFKNPDRVVWNIFKRIAVAPELETLRNGIEFFVREYVLSRNKDFAGKFKVAKKALNSVEVLLH